MAVPHAPQRRPQPNPYQEDGNIVRSSRSNTSIASMSFSSLATETFTLQRLPPFDVVAKCVTTFFECTETLFFVLKELETMEMLRTVYSRSKHGATLGTLSQLCLIAAVGGQYIDMVPEVFRAALFNTGKQALDNGLFDGEGQELLKARAAALVGMFLVFEKTMLSRDYFTQAIALAHTQKLDTNERNPNIDERDWLCWKRLWRTCIYYERWLASLVGYIPAKINEADPVFSLKSDPIPYCDMETMMQGELVRLAVLSSDFLEDVYPTNGEVNYDVTTKHAQILSTWHENLPKFMTLSGIAKSNDKVLKGAVRFMHCVFLSSNLLLTRNAFVAQISGRPLTCKNPEDLEGLRKTSERCANTCLQAAYELADILVVLISENTVSKKCWMIIHSAFSSCLILLLNAISSDAPLLSPRDSVAIGRCMYVLEVCAKSDVVARRDLQTLRHFQKELDAEFASRAAPLTPPVSRHASDSSLESGVSGVSEATIESSRTASSRDSVTVASLITTVQKPFGGEACLLPSTDMPEAPLTAPFNTSTAGKGFNWRFVGPDLPLQPQERHQNKNIVIAMPSADATSPTSRKRRLDALDYSPDAWRAPVRLKSLSEYREFFKRV